QYLAALPLGARYAVRSLRFSALPGAPPLRLVKAGLFDGDGARALGVSTASAYVSDEVRLAEVAGTPLVSLFEVRRGIGPAWVVESLRRLPDAARVLVVVRAAGPGLLVVGEGYDPGFSARVDGAPAGVLRVNGDRLGVVLQDGTHR